MTGFATGFRDRAIVTRGESTGHQDPTTYEWIPGDEDHVVLDSECNAQAGGLIAAKRRSVSDTLKDADGVLTFPKHRAGDLMGVQPDDKVKVLYAPIRRGDAIDYFTADAEARFVRPEDRALVVRYV